MSLQEKNETGKDLISVIIPVYNVEKYLTECLDSVVSQTYGNFEAILINDGSTDGSPEICKSFCERDSRFRLFSTENRGLALARNRGMDEAKGEFICFLDSDDAFHERYLEILHDLIVQHEADFSCCDCTRKDPPVWITDSTNIHVDSGDAVLENMHLHDESFITVVWNKLYRRQMIEANNLRFEAGRIYEDMLFTPMVLYHSKKAVFTDDKLYYYRVRDDSIMHRQFSLKSLHFHDNLCRRAEFFKKNGKKDLYYKDLDKLVFKTYKSLGDFESNRDNEEISQAVHKIFVYLKTETKKPSVFLHLSIKSKIKVFLMLFRRF